MKHGFSDENIMLLWVPGHSGIQNNEDVDFLARGIKNIFQSQTSNFSYDLVSVGSKWIQQLKNRYLEPRMR
jgi:hypothetical protein